MRRVSPRNFVLLIISSENGILLQIFHRNLGKNVFVFLKG